MTRRSTRSSRSRQSNARDDAADTADGAGPSGGDGPAGGAVPEGSNDHGSDSSGYESDVGDPCAVCGLYDSPDDPLLLCDGCDVPVHLSCEGLSSVPDGDWFCATCKAGERDARCMLCFKDVGHGPMKPVRGGKGWCHTLCVFLVPDSEACLSSDVRALCGGLAPRECQPDWLCVWRLCLVPSCLCVCSALCTVSGPTLWWMYRRVPTRLV